LRLNKGALIVLRARSKLMKVVLAASVNESVVETRVEKSQYLAS
jgi:hypothetical protein